MTPAILALALFLGIAALWQHAGAIVAIAAIVAIIVARALYPQGD